VSRTKPAEVSFYFDADVLGLARVLGRLRSDVTFPGDPGDEIVRPKLLISVLPVRRSSGTSSMIAAAAMMIGGTATASCPCCRPATG
jgi:hypothetical protein